VFREFFLETREDEYRHRIKPLSSEEADQRMIAPDVKLLVLLYPKLPEVHQAGAVGATGQGK
jgi:hypothetical protein